MIKFNHLGLFVFPYNENCKEYKENNKEKIKEYKKEYRENNKEKIKEQKKDYYVDNKEKIKEKSSEKHNCPCGGRYTWGSKAKHFKSQKHQKYLSGCTTEANSDA